MAVRRWDSLRDPGIVLPAWVEHRSAIAAALNFEEWLVLRRAYGKLAAIQRAAARAVHDVDGLILDDGDNVILLRVAREELLEASELLDTYAE